MLMLLTLTKTNFFFFFTQDCVTATKEAKKARQVLKQLSLRAEDHTTSASLYAEITKQMPLLVKVRISLSTILYQTNY